MKDTVYMDEIMNDSLSSINTDPLVYRGQKPITSPGVTKKNVVIIDTSVVPDRCFQHYFVEDTIGDVQFEEGVVQEIGAGAFSKCWTLGNVRVPLSMNQIGEDAFAHCMLQIRSFELPPKPISIGDRAFQSCARLRNIAIFVEKAEKNKKHVQGLGKHLFKGCHNLATIFPDSKSLIQGLTRRFDGLPRHEICYYQSYYSTRVCLNKLEQVTGEPSSSSSEKRQPRQDILGMTPLHILALSKTQRLELYKACVEVCPSDLKTLDKWEALPIHYALENNVPLPIAEFLLEEHKRYFPNDIIYLDEFLLSQGIDFFQKASLPLVEFVFDFHAKYYGQEVEPLDWDRIIHDANSLASLEVFRCVVSKSISPRIRALEWKPWRMEIQDSILAISKESLEGECWTPMDPSQHSGIDVVEKIQSKLATYERRTTMALVELICWKYRMISTSSSAANKQDGDIRTNGRIRSGAEYIVPLVLSFLQ